jgi:hypothetical protein
MTAFHRSNRSKTFLPISITSSVRPIPFELMPIISNSSGNTYRSASWIGGLVDFANWPISSASCATHNQATSYQFMNESQSEQSRRSMLSLLPSPCFMTIIDRSAPSIAPRLNWRQVFVGGLINASSTASGKIDRRKSDASSSKLLNESPRLSALIKSVN